MTESLLPEPPLTPLLDILGGRVIPWIEQSGMQRVVIARESRADLLLPPGIHVSQKKLVSGPTSVRGRRVPGIAASSTTQWVEDDQETTRVPSLVCVVAGQADLQIGDYVLHCPEGTFIFISPGLPHPRGERSHLEGKNRQAGSCDLLWFSPRGRQMQCWLCYSRGARHEVPRGHENVFLLNDRLIQHLNNLEEEAAGREADYEKIFLGTLGMLLMATQRDIQTGRFLQRSEEGIQPERAKIHDPILRAQEYIKSHLATTLTIEKVASQVYMSETHFRRRFQAQTGQTFTAFINLRRIEQARLFLRDTDWSVSQVGEFIGFRSSAHFHTLFRRHLGISPNEYRSESRRQKPGKAASEMDRIRSRKSD